ncbi:MAG: DUF4132 domain-containing protein [Ruminococcus sp.]|uniref:DUF4132 domain-containing protein n=1 Tax=Ruminococcus sp. TaxID=41978 RepID=UPI0025E3FE96|nr:DUF4132 domain-containing protein [Ruminococcus sp.]MCR5539593.1 DUF4132 domain-containing protein [Ruminococcus sp.]
MIYGEVSESMAKLGKLLTGIGMIYTNEDIFVKYMDMDSPRDDSLLKDVKMTSAYGKSMNEMDKFQKAVKTTIIRPRDTELTSRFVCFLWAAFGASCVSAMMVLVNSYDTDKYYDFLLENLTPWLGDKVAKLYAEAGAGEFGIVRGNESEYVYDRHTAAEIAALADVVCETNDWAARVMYSMALDKADSEKDSLLIKKITMYANSLVMPKPNRYSEGWEYTMLLAECVRFSDSVRDKFTERCKSNVSKIPDFILRHKCVKALDSFDTEKEARRNGYLTFLTEKYHFKEVLPHLEYMAKEHTELYTHFMIKEATPDAAKFMAEILKKFGLPCPDLLGALHDKALSIVSLTHRNDATNLMDFVMGKKSVEEVLDEMVDAPMDKSSYETFDYYNTVGADDFFCRYYAVQMTLNGGYTKTWMSERATGLDFGKHAKEGVECLVKAGLPMNVILGCTADYIDNMYQKKDETIAKTAAAAGEYKDLLKTAELSKLSATARQIGVMAFGSDPDMFKDKLLASADDSSKAVKAALAKILGDKPDWKDDITELLSKKKAAYREIALAAIERQGSSEYKEVLEAAFESEKSAKIKDKIAVLIGAAVSSDGASAAAPLSSVDMVEELTKGGKAKKVAWAFEGSNCTVHNADGAEVEQKYLEALVLCYANMSELGVSAAANNLAQSLNPRELNTFAHNVFGKWVDLGAQAKTKYVLYFAAIHGGEAMVDILMQYIKQWGENSRGAIASEAVRAMALSGSTTALMNVDGMSRKFKNKMVRSAAADALSNAAKELGLTTEELADKIVPDLGFDENMCREFDFGPRQFKVYLGTGNTLEIFCGDKQVKNLPKPGANDDAEKAAAASADFKEMKKQLKTVAANQKSRLESVLMNDRKWTVDGWKALFVKNAVMHGFATGLIWGLYDAEGKLTQSFRYTEEGSFNTVDDDETELPAEGSIGLVHPLELTKEDIDAWKEQLSDYEIEQPFPQLDRKIYTMTDEERESTEILRFENIELNSLSLIGKLTKTGWYKGYAEDAGWFYYFWREDISSRENLPDGTTVSKGVHAELNFSGASIVNYDFEGEEVTIEKLELHRPSADHYRSTPIKVGEVGDRYFSELIMQLTSVLGEKE